jgi:choice-of-anchor A domain-containing protein
MKTCFTNCKSITIALTIATIAILGIFSSNAQNPLIAENYFNIITEGNLSITQGDIEGAIAVGGNLIVLGNSQRTSANATGGQAFMTFNNVKYALVVNGGLTGTNGGNVFKIDGKGAASDDHFIRFGTIGSSTAAGNGGGIDIGNPVTDNTKRYIRVNSTNQAANTVVNTTDLINFSDVFASFRASSTSISSCTGNVTPTVTGGQATLNLGTFANNVWNVTGSTLNSYSQINLTGNLPTASRPLIINVNAAGTFNWSNLKFVMGSESDNSMEINRAPYILWNFYNATTLNIQSSNLVLGSILAPNADLRNNGFGNITGQIVAKTFTKPNAGELHIAKFNANVTCATTYDCGCVTSASNVLVNPSFEQNGSASTTGWAHAGQGSISAGNGFVACGSFNGFNNNPNGTGESLVYQDVTNNITSGIDFTFSGFAATHEVSCNPRLYVEYYSTTSGTGPSGGRIGNRVEVTVTKDVDTDGKLALYTIDGVTPAGTVRIRVGTVINCDYVKMDAYCLTLNCTKPATPTKGTITGPTCAVSTGSVVISGLPSSGTWSLERTGTSSATITGTGTSTTISGLAPGTYAFKVTSNLGCISNELTNVVIPEAPSAPTLTATPTNITCFGSNNGLINVMVSGGLSPYTFNWGSGQPTTEDRTDLAAGTYNVIVTDANSCTKTASATITEPTALTVAQTSANPLCFGGTNGSIDLTVTGGKTAYTYNWGAGQPTTQDRTGLAAGTYNVIVSDARGCTKTASIVISNPAELNLSTTQINPSCSGGATGSIDLTVTGGTANYTYNWGAGQPTTQDRTGLSADTYNVIVTDANGCTKSISVTITEPVPSSLGNYTFIDNNANGIQDASDLPLDGVLVKLYNANPNGTPNGNAIATATTAGGGLYNFPSLCAGNYLIEFGLATGGYNRTIQANNDSKDATDSDANPTTGFTSLITIAAGDNDLTNDAGYYKPASLGNYVWEDNNVNGQQDSGEPFISNVTVSLQDASGNPALDVNGNPVPNTTTNGVGVYGFTNLKPGVGYVVVFSKPSGYVPTTANSGNDNTDSDANPTTGKSQVVTLASGENNLTIDAGFFKPASLGNYVWEDKNLNGQQDGTEPAIPNVIVSLRDGSGNPALDANGNVVPSTTTNGIGDYNFTNLKPGTGYVVVFTKPSGYAPTVANLGNDASDSDANISDGKSPVITLVAGENNLTIDAGFFKIASLGNYVWEDKNLNGLQDSGEPGIPNVTVSLQDALGNPALDINGNPVANTTTNAMGEYNFTNLKPGEPYTVVFTKPAGYYPTVANSGNDATDSDANVTNGKAPIVVLTSGEYNETIDAGFYKPASIGNFVWEDKNANGQQESGEPGIPNVSVSLQDALGNPALDINGNPVTSTTTNGNGEYIFTNLMPGVPYIVVFSKPSGYTSTQVNTGDHNSDSDANTLTGKSQPVTLTSGEYNQTVDAGYYKLASLGNYAWYDANRNGLQDGGELPASDILVELFRANGTLVGTKTTDANGLYLFENLTPGDYYIRGTHPDSFFKPTTTNKGANDEIDSDISTDLKTSIVTSLESGENDLTWDMGYYRGAKFNITDPCKCRNDATNLVNGRYNEEVTVTGTPGETWTVKTQNGILLSTSAAPPAAGTTMPLGTQLTETPVGSGMFKLTFQHVDAIGYAISVTNENTPGIDPLAIFTGNQTNVCVYPEPNYTKVTNTACSNAQPIELIAQPNMPGAIKYTLSNVNTQQLIDILPDGNGKFFINPANVPAAKYDLIIEFTPTDPAKCNQIDVLTAEFEVKTCAPLPVNLVSFDAKNIDDKVVLNWKTASEKNFSHFEVQQGGNLSEFSDIGTVNTNLTGLYSLIDNKPNLGNNYYRLKMVDNDGSFEFSKTIAVQVNKNESYVIAENPAVNGQFNLITNLKNPHFSLYNSLATNVYINVKVEGENKFNIEAKNYTSGTYYLTINSEGKIITKKIIIP